MRGDLSVRIDDGIASRIVTARTSGLRFSKNAYGGHLGASMTLDLPAGFFTDLGPNDKVHVTDARTGRTLWEGDTDNPGVRRGPAGQSYDLIALGGAARASDLSLPLAYTDWDLSGWVRGGDSSPRAETRNDELDAETPTLQVHAREDKTLTTGWQGVWVNRDYRAAGLRLGWVRAQWDAGVTGSNFLVALRTRRGAGGITTAAQASASTSGGTMSASSVTNFPNGDDIPMLWAFRASTEITGAEAHWFQFYGINVVCQRVTATGAAITSGYNTGLVYAHQVIADMIGRGMIPGVSGSRASIETTTQSIDQLTFLDGATFSEVMDALSVFEDLTWGVGATVGDGLEFYSRIWDDDDHRYVITSADGLSLPGQENTLCNRILVTWDDARGRPRSLTVTADVPALGSRTRDADPVALPQGYGSAANAARAGARILAATNNPPKAGTAVVTRRVWDTHAGCWVMPWELEPGWSVLVRDLGETFRLTEFEYVDDDAAAYLTLGTPIRSPEQIVADLARRARRTKRRR